MRHRKISALKVRQTLRITGRKKQSEERAALFAIRVDAMDAIVRSIGHVIFETFFKAKNITITGINSAMMFQTPMASKTT